MIAARGTSLLFAAACLLSLSAARESVPTYTIDLDLPPAERYNHIVPAFNSTVWGFFNKYFAHDKVLTDALYLLTDVRGKEPAEMQAEVEGLAAVSKLPLKFVQGIQMLYELQTLMVPMVNFSAAHAPIVPALNLTHAPIVPALNLTHVDPLPAAWAALKRIPWRGPGCTGIIARCAADGTVYHARNLDFTPVAFMKPLVYTGIFTQGGKELYRSQQIAGYVPAVTGMRRGADGFAIERNTRYTDHVGGNEEMLKHVLGGRPLNGWSVRQALETCADYDCAVQRLSTVPYASTEFAIISGVKKGTILARAPDFVAHTQTLPESSSKAYILITNFDFYWHDARAWFDPTGGRMFRPRRLVAQQRLEASTDFTHETLFETINADGVLADTIFQAIINVEKDLWNVSKPDLERGVSMDIGRNVETTPA